MRRRSWDDFVRISKLVPKIRMIAFSWDNASHGSMTTSTVVHQNVAIDELQEIAFDKNLKDDTPLTPQTHTAHRSVLGQMNWLQSRIPHWLPILQVRIQGSITVGGSQNHQEHPSWPEILAPS